MGGNSRLAEGAEYCFEGIVEALLDITIPDSDDRVAALSEPLASARVSFKTSILSMPASVDLDDELAFEADEISDEGSDRVLPAKAPSSKAFASQMLPDDPFFVC